MDPNKIFEYVTEGMKLAAIGGGSYVGALLGINLIHGFSQRIRSQEELEMVVDEEATKLGLDPSKIDATYNGKTDGARKNRGRYDLHLIGDWLSTRAAVRHELYHILKDCDKGKPTLISYLFLEEPRALMYGSFKLKL